MLLALALAVSHALSSATGDVCGAMCLERGPFAQPRSSRGVCPSLLPLTVLGVGVMGREQATPWRQTEKTLDLQTALFSGRTAIESDGLRELVIYSTLVQNQKVFTVVHKCQNVSQYCSEESSIFIPMSRVAHRCWRRILVAAVAAPLPRSCHGSWQAPAVCLSQHRGDPGHGLSAVAKTENLGAALPGQPEDRMWPIGIVIV